VNRRHFLFTASAALASAASNTAPIIDTHIHLFADDAKRFPFHKDAVYKPQPSPLEPYNAFVREARIDHTVIIHPEPYQDDHAYLEYCFKNEPSPNFFAGSCLFDPIREDTGDRMKELVKRNPGRIKSLRIHTNREAGVAPTTSGPIRDRDLNHPIMRTNIRKAHDLGLSIQMHCIPLHAPEIAKLAREFSSTPFIIDHLARAGFGTPEQYETVLGMAKLGNVYMKFSGVGYSSKQPAPHLDAKPLVRRTFDAFGPQKMIWGGLGANMKAWKQAQSLFETQLDFASEKDRAQIRGLTAAKLFGWNVA
jgi:predicted TIM-barrel fold metal-dependent hydrolase